MPLLRGALAALVTAFALSGCDETESSGFSCVGQVVTSVEECSALLVNELRRQDQALAHSAFALEMAGYETGYRTVSEMIQQANTSSLTIGEMIASTQSLHEHGEALVQSTEMTESTAGQQALADFYARQAEIYQRQADLIQQQRERDEAAYRAWEARQAQLQQEEADRLRAVMEQKIHEDELYRDEISAMDRERAEWADAVGP